MKEVIITSLIVALLGFGAAKAIIKYNDSLSVNQDTERQSLVKDLPHMGFSQSELEYMGYDKMVKWESGLRTTLITLHNGNKGYIKLLGEWTGESK